MLKYNLPNPVPNLKGKVISVTISSIGAPIVVTKDAIATLLLLSEIKS